MTIGARKQAKPPMRKKYSVAVHETDLKNGVESANMFHKQIEKMRKQYQQQMGDLQFLRYQIEEAKKCGKKEFDASLFRAKHKPDRNC